MNTPAGIKAYTTVGMESGVSAADPHKLISMLYQGALLAIANARLSIQRNDVSAKGASISKAIAIVDEGLNACLDKNVGGELAQNLSSLYEYIVIRLLSANLKNDITILDEVTSLLTDLKGAWEAIRPGAQPGNLTAPMAGSPAAVAEANTTQSAIGKQASILYGRV